MVTRPHYESSYPGFVGRRPEIAALDAALGAACSECGGVALLAGEPGIGKTRLAAELSDRAIGQGVLVLWGRCYEGAGAPAFWPWVQIVRAYVQSRDPNNLRAEIRAGAADLAALAPELLDHLPETRPAPPIEGAQARFRLFDSLSSTLVRASHTQPLLLIIDDLHWADRSSLLLLGHLAHDLPTSRVLVVGTYRESEIDRRHPLSATIAALARLDTTLHLSLNGLAAAEVTQVITMITGWSPSDAQLVGLMDATAGNPFFVAQLARLLAQSEAQESPSGGRQPWRATLPLGVRAAVTQRLHRLSQPCQQLLQVAAVIGREFSLRLLRDVGAVPGAALLDALSEAVHAQLIIEPPAQLGSYRFIHALVRETLYDALPPAERIRLHRQAGMTLAMVYGAEPDEHLAELAYHFFQAAPDGDVTTALTYSVQAARRSSRLLAYEDAALHYIRALQLLDLDTTDEPLRRCDLLLELGMVQERSGATQASRGTYEQAAALARLHAEAPRLAQAALGLAGTVVTPGVVDEHVIALLTEALGALGDTDSLVRARVLGRLAMEYRYSPFRERRDALSAEAVAVARRLNNPAALAAALQARHYALLAPDTLDQRMAVTIELGRLADINGNRELLLQSMPWRVADLFDLGHMQAADAAIAETAQLATDLRQPLYGWYVAMFRAQRALMDGRLAEGERLADAAHTLGQQVQPRVSQIYYAAQLFVVRREQGRLPELEPLFAEILEQYPGMPIFRCFLALVYLQAGQPGQARLLLTALSADRCAVLPWDQLWLGGVALLAEVCVVLGDATIAAELYDLLLPYSQRNVMVGVPICLGAVALYLGLLADMRGEYVAAERHLTDALAINERLGIRLFLVRALVAYATLLQREGHTERAMALLERAQATANLRELPELRLRLTAPSTTAVAAPSELAHGLTARELATLRLIAQGKSTKEIAAMLAISVSTVERHITHLYAKIAARSRAEATAFALRHQLLEQQP